MRLTADIPGGHFYAFVRSEFTHDMREEYRGEFEACAVYGVAVQPARCLMFHVLLKSGASFANVPLHALCWKQDAPARPIQRLQVWDMYGWDFVAHRYEYLRERSARCYLRDGEFADGDYVFTVECYDDGYSTTPDQHKNWHVIALDEGNYAALPNNRILWKDGSFVRWPEKLPPDYLTNTHVWHAEQDEKQIDPNVMGGDATDEGLAHMGPVHGCLCPSCQQKRQQRLAHRHDETHLATWRSRLGEQQDRR